VRALPSVAVPGANTFWTDHDASTSDGLITCRQVSLLHELYDLAKAARYLRALVP
jgi:hypothetical protein